MLMEFSWESYEIAWRFWGPSPEIFLSLPNYRRPPTPLGQYSQYMNNSQIWRGGEIWKGVGGNWDEGGVQMKHHECMHLGGQQQFHAALSLYMKVILRILNVLHA